MMMMTMMILFIQLMYWMPRFTRFPYFNDPAIRPEKFYSTEEEIVMANPRLVDCALLAQLIVRQGGALFA